MFYREAGQFKASYAEDNRIFTIRQDRIGFGLILFAAFVLMPLLATPYFFEAILIPFLIFSLAAIGLNILTGYAGQVSLGTGAFMAVGAYAAYNLMLRIDGMPVLLAFVLGGLCAALVGIVFGLPSLRIRGFYLAASTLATQFFIIWCVTKIPWLTNYSTSGVITAQRIEIFGYVFNSPAHKIEIFGHIFNASPADKYLLVLSVVSLGALLAKNLVRSNIGRSWMAIRDMDMAAEVIGFRPMRTKILAFAVSSFYCGVAGALYAYAYLGSVEPEGFSLDLSFRILFMIIIGGLGSILGSFFGAAFIVLLPIFLSISVSSIESVVGHSLPSGIGSSIQLMVFGALIVFFLIVEPQGLARLWQIAKEKLRLWPFPH
jgi:branched-chain amino acid transport system permease protein